MNYLWIPYFYTPKKCYIIFFFTSEAAMEMLGEGSSGERWRNEPLWKRKIVTFYSRFLLLGSFTFTRKFVKQMKTSALIVLSQTKRCHIRPEVNLQCNSHWWMAIPAPLAICVSVLTEYNIKASKRNQRSSSCLLAFTVLHSYEHLAKFRPGIYWIF